jgi:hypothetical protein
VLAQGQDKGGGGKERVKERPAPTGKAAQNLPPTDPMVEKNAPKGKAAKDAQNAMKGAEDQGKKMGTVAGEAVEKGKGKGKGAEQQAKAFQKQLQQEQAKHMERVARLNRIRELALKQGDTTTVARVDKLIAKEQEVFGRKQVRIQGQPRATLPPTGAEKTAPPTTVGPDEAAKGKAMPPAPAEKAGKNDKGAVKKPEAKPQEAPKP